MDIQIETQDVEMPAHANKFLRNRIRSAMDKVGLQISRLHLSLRDVNGKKGGRAKVCTVRATLVSGGEVVVIDRGHRVRESLLRALRRSRSLVRRELIRRRQRERKARVFVPAAAALEQAAPA